MEKSFSAANANRKFSRVLRDVREGQSYIVTSHGKPVARIAPIKEECPASGAKLTATVIRELKRRNGRYGMVTMCVGGGMGAAGIFENVN